MATTKKQIPPIVKFGAWLLTTIAFIVGFWHAHLGLKNFNIFNSEYGSLAVAGIVLLLILLSYNLAVNGRKSALYFYIFGGLLFFVFNLNYFYPSYLGRTLVKEEATFLNNTLQTFNNKSSFQDESGTTATVSKLYKLKEQLLNEIRNQSGFGERAKDYLNQFNALCDGSLKPSLRIGNTQEDRENIAREYEEQCDNEIYNYVLQKVAGGNAVNAEKYLEGKDKLEFLSVQYTPLLQDIIADRTTIELDSVMTHPQINTLQNLVTSIDNATIKINEATKSEIFPKLEEAKTRNLGKAEHTIASIKERIGEIDTWFIIFICLFLDLLVPLFIYVMIRRKDDDEDADTSFWDNITGKKKPSTF